MAGVVYPRNPVGTHVSDDDRVRSLLIARFSELVHRAFANPGTEHTECALHLRVDAGSVSLHDHPSPVLENMRDISENDPNVVNRAKHAADKPYDRRTCRVYPWAAAARITFLETELARQIKGFTEYVNSLYRPLVVQPGDIDADPAESWLRPGPITLVPYPARRQEITRKELMRYNQLLGEIESEQARTNRNKTDMAKKIYDPAVRKIMLDQLQKESDQRVAKFRDEIIEMRMPLQIDDPVILEDMTGSEFRYSPGVSLNCGGAGAISPGKVSINTALGLQAGKERP